MPRMGDLAATDVYSAFDVPGEQTYDRRLDQTWPGRLAQEAIGAVLAPGRALQATEPITTEQMIKPAMDLAGLVTGGSYAAPAQRGASGAGIRAYHSSPHDFDKFDLAKIGTGEGAQVYGHGLYFAESPAVSGQGGQYWQQFARRFMGPDQPREVVHAMHILEKEGGNRAAALENIDRVLRDNIKTAYPRESMEATRALLASDKPVGPRTYEVNIKGDPAQMLDWDKPLREQAVQDVLMRLGSAQKNRPLLPTDTGRDVYSKQTQGLFKDSASERLREAGIPGIKYLDQGSRGDAARIATLQERIAREQAQGLPVEHWQKELATLSNPLSSNYVIFDPGIIDIMKKYGIAGAAPVGMGALAAQDRYEP